MFAGTLFTRSPLAPQPEAPWWLPGTPPDESFSPSAFRDEDEDLDDLDDEDFDDLDDDDEDDEDDDEDEDGDEEP